MPDFALEARLRGEWGPVIVGIDEAGRGPWAGPVVAAAVDLAGGHSDPELLDQIDDSKKLSKPRREQLFERLVRSARFGVALATVEEIDRLNILAATLLAMARAVSELGFRPDAALVDGNRAPRLDCPLETVVKGDSRSLSIAAASIVAKVSRDRLMAGLARRHPGYGWDRNQGYGTAAHQDGLKRLGVTPEHRRSFRPVREALSLTI